MMNNSYLCIACRLSSKRLPNKALLKLTDKPVIEVLIERLCQKFLKEHIILCTTKEVDSYKLREIANKYEINYYEGDKEDVMKRFIDATSQYKDCKNIIRITGDNPMTDTTVMKEMILYHNKNNFDYTYTESIHKGLRCEIIDREYLVGLHKRISNTNNTEYMTYYLKMDKDSKIGNFGSENKVKESYTFTIDREKDLQFMRDLIKKTPHGIQANSKDLSNTVKNEYGLDFTNIEPPVKVDMQEFRINDKR